VEPTAFHEYDPDENIVYVRFPTVTLETQDDIRRHFDAAVEFWSEHCGGRKVFYVVNYDGLTINLRENDFYAEQLKRVLPLAITIVRYGGDPLQRTAVRLVNMKLHAPTRLCESLEEALAFVRALRGAVAV
jgi:hypothetical protein